MSSITASACDVKTLSYMRERNGKRTERVATVRQLRASWCVGETVERVFQVRVLDKGARVAGVGLVDRARRAVARVAEGGAGGGRGLVVLRDRDADRDTRGNEGNERDEGANDLQRGVV